METKKELAALPVEVAQYNPLSLLQSAIEKNADVATIERLVSLAKDMDAFTAKKAYDNAVAEFQKNAPVITKTRKAKIESSKGPGYSYTFAGLSDISKIILPKLGALGLSISYRMVETKKAGTVAVICRLTHSFGHYEESGTIDMPIPSSGGSNEAQRQAIAISYAKRYALTAMLGLAPEDEPDTDGHSPPVPIVRKSQLVDPPKPKVQKEAVEIVAAFKRIGISREMLEGHLGESAETWNMSTISYLQETGAKLKAAGKDAIAEWIAQVNAPEEVKEDFE